MTTTSQLRPGERRARVDKEELFRLVGYQPHAGQVSLHESAARYRVLACGSRWGKSLAASMEVVAALLEPAEQARGWIVAPSRDLVERIFERVLAIFREHLAHRIAEHDQRQQRLVVRNLGGGLSEVRGKSAQDAVSLLGESLDFLIVDEAARMSANVWQSHLAARLVDRKGWALLVSTPNGPNWFFRLYRNGQRGRDASVESWRSPSWANPHLDRELIEEERRRLPRSVFEEQFCAEFVAADPEPCASCGGPSPDLPGVSLVVTDGDLGHCLDCAGLVDPAGLTLMRLCEDGKARAKVVLLRPTLEASA